MKQSTQDHEETIVLVKHLATDLITSAKTSLNKKEIELYSQIITSF